MSHHLTTRRVEPLDGVWRNRYRAMDLSDVTCVLGRPVVQLSTEQSLRVRKMRFYQCAVLDVYKVMKQSAQSAEHKIIITIRIRAEYRREARKSQQAMWLH